LVRQLKTPVFLGRNLGTNISYAGSQSVNTPVTEAESMQLSCSGQHILVA